MSKDEILMVADVVAESRRLSCEMRRLLDDLDSVLDLAEERQTDEIARLEADDA